MPVIVVTLCLAFTLLLLIDIQRAVNAGVNIRTNEFSQEIQEIAIKNAEEYRLDPTAKIMCDKSPRGMDYEHIQCSILYPGGSEIKILCETKLSQGCKAK